MIPCLPEHIGENPCPECVEPHLEYAELPSRRFTFAECQEIVKNNNIDYLLPIFRIEDKTKEGYHMPQIPAIITINDTTVRMLWNSPENDFGWIVVTQDKNVQYPYQLALRLGEKVRAASNNYKKIAGRKVIHNDTELPEIDLPPAKKEDRIDRDALKQDLEKLRKNSKPIDF